MSIRTTIDAPDIRPDTIGPEHLKSDPDSLGKITGNVLRLFGDSIVIGTGKSLTHGSTVIVGSDAKVPWSALKNHVSITAGEGLTGGGSLSGNVTLSVDSTVVRTTGNFTLSGILAISNNLIVSGSGRLGVGTASPQHELHIESAAPVLRLHSSASNSPEGVKIRLTEDQWQGAYIHYEADSNRLDIGVHEPVDTLPENDIPVISILRSNRQVGIGTTSPSYPLHVSGDFGFTGTLQQGTVPWARLSGHPSIIAGTGLSGGGPLSSSQTLSVVYGSTAGTAVEGNKQITVTAGANLSGGGTITLGSGGSVSLSVVNDPTFSGSVTTPLVTNTGTLALTGSGSSGAIVFSTNGAERMRITSQGRVGIGTTAPSYALHVAGDVGFSGTLQQGTVPWARLSGHPSITAGTGLTGGGSLSSSRTLSVNFGSSAGTVAEGNKTITVIAGDGLSGGGTVTIGAGGSVTLTNADPGSAQNIFKRIANSSGTVQFAAASNDDVLQFAAGTGLSVAFDAENKRITYSHALKAGTGIQVSGDTITNTGIISLSAGSGISVSGTNPATITNTDRGSAQNIFKNIANASGTTQFSAGSNSDTLRFAAGGILSVAFDADNKQITYSASLTAGTNISINGSQIATVANPTFSTSVTTPSLISTYNLSLTAQGANNIILTTNNTERMRIASSGNVGIGTNSPSETLHVQGRVLISSTGHETAGHLQVERVHNEQGNKLKVVIDSNPGWQTGLLPNRSISLLSQEAASIALGFEDGQILPLVVSSQGRVGIGGKVSPQYALDVTGDVAFSGTLQAGNIPADRITSGTLGVARGGTGRSSLASGQILFGAGTSAVGLDSNLYWDNSNKRLGVGTSAPAYPLDVAGDVRFTGTLRGGTIPWERLSGVPSASTSSAGIVQLTDSVSSDSVTTAATPRSVKQAIERARESPIAIKAGHLFHFDHGLQSTRGLRPLPGYVATLRPGEGRFGGAVAVEEGTTNLIPSDRLKFEGWTAYQGASVTVEQGYSIPGITPDGATRIQTSGGTGALKYYFDVGPGAAGTPASYRVWVRNIGDKPVEVYGNIIGGSNIVYPGETKLCTGSTDAVNGTTSRQIQFLTLDVDDNLDFIAYQPQIEEKPYPTSFVDGTRERGRLSYPKSLIAGLNALTVAAWTSGPPYWDSGNKYLVAAQTSGTNPYGDLFALVQQGVNNRIRLWVRNDANSAGANVEYDNVWDGNWHLIVGVINKSPQPGRRPIELYVDGELVASSSNVNAVPDLFNIDETWGVQVGHWRGSNHWNGLLDELLILPYAASEEEIKAWYESKAPFYDPESKAPFYDPEGIIDVSQGGTGHKSLPEGQILFGSGTEPIGSDPGLYWNNNTKRLGVGTSAPQEQLHVAGKIRVDQGIKLSGFEIVYNPTTRSIDFNFTS